MTKNPISIQSWFSEIYASFRKYFLHTEILLILYKKSLERPVLLSTRPKSLVYIHGHGIISERRKYLKMLSIRGLYLLNRFSGKTSFCNANCPLNQGNSKLQVTNQRNCSLWTQIFYSGRVESIEWDDLLYHKVSRNSETIKLVKGWLLLPCLEITRSLEILNLKRPTSHTNKKRQKTIHSWFEALILSIRKVLNKNQFANDYTIVLTVWWQRF